MVGLLLAHALFGLSNNELMVFFAGDVLFPLAVVTGRPKAPTAALGMATTIYYVALFGYGGLGP
jgi:flagellar biosynthesis component FlhA